jgi:hypothetical protein
MRRAVWGIPQAGILANKCLYQKLAPFGYHESENTPGLWYHESHPITFTLVVEDFGVKYICKENVPHLITSIKTDYTITKDWTGNLYCGIQLDWDYKKRTVDISMPGYVKNKLQEYGDIMKFESRRVLTNQNQKNLVLKRKPPSHPTHRQNWMVKESNASSKLLVVYCTTHKLLT